MNAYRDTYAGTYMCSLSENPMETQTESCIETRVGFYMGTWFFTIGILQ